jgi:hypothetical protein
MSSTDQPAALGRPSPRHGRGGAQAPHPLEYSESGFPFKQRTPSFVERVSRPLDPL